jgi:hypothetical protein
VKAARTVTTGGMGRHSTAVRPVPTHWEALLPELAEVAERRRPLGNRGRMGALVCLSGRFLAHRYTVDFIAGWGD